MLFFSEIISSKVHVQDGECGKIIDLLVDDRSFHVRYFVIDTSNWLSGKKVVISPESLNQNIWKMHEEAVFDLTKSQIENSPLLEKHLPVSRRHEEDMASYFNWKPYWNNLAIVTFPYPDISIPGTTMPHVHHSKSWQNYLEQRGQNFYGHLRSLCEIQSYKVSSIDGEKFGEVEDFSIDTESWQVADLIISTHRWLPGGKQVACSPMFIEGLDEVNGFAEISLTKDSILKAPEFDIKNYGLDSRLTTAIHFMADKGQNPMRESS